MTYRIFLDDIREPPRDGHDWIVVRSFWEAKQLVLDKGFPAFVAFDHDLGMMDNKTGKDFANFLVHYALDMDEKPFLEWSIHSANPVGARNIDELLRNFFHRE